MQYKISLLLLLLLLIVSLPASAMPAKIIRVIDGDTIKIAAPWLPAPLPKEISIRLAKIDTPEKGGRAKCQRERDLAAQASLFTKQKVAESKTQEVIIQGFDKYGSRLVGDMVLDGKNLSKMLMDKGLAVRYEGGQKKSWCEAK